jgi:hypothetical protein
MTVNGPAEAVDQDDFGLLLTVVKGEIDEEMGAHSRSYRQFCAGSWVAGTEKPR